ncbi:TIGR03087 family PEP-CTERM/XrtA system glycosyltransferase [Sphingobium sufflavum]|uniref:TIGR03087 family PEP-CTERM/XrtA system glycosyltransferase n=1 Tax=Sphingobium sufflavum TaxID=1129547 RepID=UPI001F2AFBA7|nr:TIGR03087 family PEP-CTERM/XrtA system glycosyltransferase [Sphingobium sufflavum]MCE7797380.1 TIGR03087 family PEP-CTERM/XrtA system glycosyltransferase [Sphingobium sufflavum]
MAKGEAERAGARAEGLGEILFIAHRVPYPPDRGDKIRSYHELRHLARLAPVHLAALADDPRDLHHGEALSALTASHCVRPRTLSRPRAAVEGLLRREPMSVALFRDRGLRGYVERIVATRPLAAVFVYSGNMAPYVPTALDADTRFVMDLCDVDSAKFAAYGAAGGGVMGWINRREGRLLGALEVAVAKRADAALFISRAEADVFATLDGADGSGVSVVGNGVDLDAFDPAQPRAVPAALAAVQGPRIVFTGQMDYRPNIEAVTDFAAHALPIVRQRHPDAQFVIVGRNPADAVRALADSPGVMVTGEVDDTRAWLAAADVVVAPLRLARGVQNKVLEAMAMARPMVVSTAAAEGIDAEHGRDFLIAADAEEEGRLVADLLSNPARAAALGQAGRARVEARYSWDAALAPLTGLVFGDGG